MDLREHRVDWKARAAWFGRGTAQASQTAALWLGERFQDLALWPANLLRDLPLRVARLATSLWTGVVGLMTFLPQTTMILADGGPSAFRFWVRAAFRRSAAWSAVLGFRLFDLVGGPELLGLITRATTRSTPLTGEEIGAAAGVLGPNALRYGEVRVVEGGILRLVFRLNGNRAFTAFHTINLPFAGGHTRSHTEILVHELTHVYQYERIGSLYIGEAIRAQATAGYDYGGPAGLLEALAVGRLYRDYNREQQAQIVQDYFTCRQDSKDVTAYESFITQMREGLV